MTAQPLPSLEVHDFADFFAAVWSQPGRPAPDPFPWQRELLEQVHREQRWPRVVDLPTGTGKTSLVDLAVFLLALGADEDPATQWHPRRIAMVVDRRVIVDQAADRAALIAERLAKAESGVVRAVADRLRSLAPAPDGSLPEQPLRHTVLRGGIVRDETWAQRPDVPAVIASTVDQVGSRLLFRGYGISRGMRPVHAGLLGEDTLYLLDEVHLARPYAQTLDAVRRYRGGRHEQLPDRWQVVRLSATPDDDDPDRFPHGTLDPDGHPVLTRRLTAHKPARLVEVTTPADEARAHEKLASECVRHAIRLVGGGARTLAIIVNRVDTARRARTALAALRPDIEAYTLTGRMRPYDRAAILRQVLPRLRMGRVRTPDDEPLIIISTQSIEAGADFDLDAIVTECASLDALRQRFGRVDRDGHLSADGRTVESIILAASRDLADLPDPVYGTALFNTWRWLASRPDLDFGINQLAPPTDRGVLASLVPHPVDAPHLLPSHLDRWVRTSDYGVAADPEVAQWLHGLDASNEAADVGVVWREDVDADLLATAGDDGVAAGLCQRVNACPPSNHEALAIPVNAFRRWLRGSSPDWGIADTWAPGGEAEVLRGPSTGSTVVLRWRDDQAAVVDVANIGPGDTVIVPASWGGISYATWDPESTVQVSDVAAETGEARPPILRLSRVLKDRVDRARAGVRQEAPDEPLAEVLYPDPADLTEMSRAERLELIRAYCAYAAELLGEGSEAELLRHAAVWDIVGFDGMMERRTKTRDLSSYVVALREPATVPPLTSVEEDGRDGSSFVGRPVTLTDHLDGVARWAGQIAANLGLPAQVCNDVAEAGRLHDLGKLDPRFQLWLHGADELAAAQSVPLAKSSGPGDRRSRLAARNVSRYPRGQRHELLSLSLAESARGDLQISDLVRHLVVSHHGGARYRSPAQRDPECHTVDVELDGVRVTGSSAHDLDRLDSGIAERFAALTRTWGWFGLAWLEAVLRLADHAESRRPDITQAMRGVS